jgi:hypothetical protein
MSVIKENLQKFLRVNNRARDLELLQNDLKSESGKQCWWLKVTIEPPVSTSTPADLAQYVNQGRSGDVLLNSWASYCTQDNHMSPPFSAVMVLMCL